MRLKFFPLIASALLLSGGSLVKADSVIEVHTYNSGSEQYALSKDFKIDFTSTGFDLLSGASDVVAIYDLSNVQKISFIADTSVESLKDSSVSLLVTPNPVVDLMTIRGGEELVGTEINIYSVEGQNVVRVSNWQGESIDVSHLSSGIYIINTQSKNLKFIKL
ncbi:MAG: T9SS type A sorting domain-containing protein [Muribaculaceae bacterium]|nr:T9SS type A sorting domain-containing protein [Muribaculaceae bacterium]